MGLERGKINLDEYLNFPYSELDLESIKKLQFSEISFDTKISLLNQKKNHFDFQNWELKINKLYNLCANVIIRISDSLTLSVDLFHKQEKSIALYPVKQTLVIEYSKVISSELNDFLDKEDLFVNATIYDINRYSPLMMIKLTHEKAKREIYFSPEKVDSELKKIDEHLWEKKSQNIYFRKKLNYSKGDDIYIIRPNQRRFWSKSMALEDASELILEMLNGVHDEK